MTVLWTIVGIALFFFGLLLSIAWHELGHFTTARWFGIKVPEFFVGFGKTIWSRRRGETEFGIKAIPLGGYVRMIGMLPPAPGHGRLGRSRRTGPFQGLMDDARAQSQADVLPQDADRQFWTRAPWKRIVVMFAGPFMNLVLAVFLMAVILMGIGLPASGTQVSEVSKCVVPATAQTAQSPTPDCPAGAPLAPAAAAGMLPGDRIVGLAGKEYGRNDGTALREAIRVASGPTPLVVDRNGQRIPLTVNIVPNQVQDMRDPSRTVSAGFVGVSLLPGDYVRQGPGAVADLMGFYVARTGQSIAEIPQRVPALFRAAFLGEQRDPEGPVGVVGVSRIGGQILAQEEPWREEVTFFLQLLAGVNISLFVLNLLPIPPLDGGQIVPAIWEAIKRRLARLAGRPDPGPVDAAKLLPVAYVFVMVFLAFSAVLLVADIVNPVRLPG
ncbi:M50 family metallopeptidase [Pseudonocardia phyllosphaerae]|uniref:M50 family metallopeptidase n=1 Tax=Pseudonocardia phyllosphaerae TaxID=3390502 RepID=UPI00397BDA93